MNDKKQQLIDTALTLFYRHGVNRVGINEVLKVSGIAKKTLYNHFVTKDDLVLATLVARDDAFIRWLDKNIQCSSDDKTFVVNFFDALSQWFNDDVSMLESFNGCFFINTSAEYPDKQHPVSLQCRAHKQRVRALIMQYLGNSSLVELVCMLKEGAIVAAYVNGELDAADRAKIVVLNYLKNLERAA